ncbi:MAG: hypothetical protein AAFO02_25110, partial [Bacteroidota bacterium]
VKYLRDSQVEVLNAQREEKGLAPLSSSGRSTDQLDDYVRLGPGAQSYMNPHSVLLIDEIDKAPREFPNDLLYDYTSQPNPNTSDLFRLAFRESYCGRGFSITKGSEQTGSARQPYAVFYQFYS